MQRTKGVEERLVTSKHAYLNRNHRQTSTHESEKLWNLTSMSLSRLNTDNAPNTYVRPSDSGKLRAAIRIPHASVWDIRVPYRVCWLQDTADMRNLAQNIRVEFCFWKKLLNVCPEIR